MSHAKQGKLDTFVKAAETKSLNNILRERRRRVDSIYGAYVFLLEVLQQYQHRI